MFRSNQLIHSVVPDSVIFKHLFLYGQHFLNEGKYINIKTTENIFLKLKNAIPASNEKLYWKLSIKDE